MSWTVIAAKDLSECQGDAWIEILRGNPALASPFFRPEYTRCVAKELPIEVAIFSRDGQPISFFPFERVNESIAIAPGRSLADYQGIIRFADDPLDMRAMLSQANISRWEFDHLLIMDGQLNPWCWTNWESPQIDLKQGTDHYFADLFSRHANLKGLRKSERRICRDIGELRFEFGCRDQSVLELLLKWKAAQYEATQRLHPFTNAWVSILFKEMLTYQQADFRGLLTVLWAGCEPLAIEYSLQSHQTLHTLVSAYNIEYSKYSPGMLRDLHLIEECGKHGITCIDMGKGLESYKKKLMNAACKLGEGSVDSFQARGYVRHLLNESRYRFLRSPWSLPAKRVARSAARIVPSIRRILSMR